ncbi:MAG: acyltransferase [Bacteroidales bacterium]|nr:acyltransferase [Bacteroidales bacterium]
MKSNTQRVYASTDKEFDDIRPLHDSEVKEAIEFLLNDKMFRAAIEPVILPVTWDDFSKQMRGFNSIYDFQKNVIYNLILKFIKNNVDKLELLNPREIDLDESHTYISNHRDIILDAGLLNISLEEQGYSTTEIAIGDNLLIYPWITTLVRLNKSFIVKRDIPVRQILEASQHLSEYMHKTIAEKKQSIWIAQREGRAKDSNDRTQASMLKMLTLTDRKNPIESLKKLDIVPLSISYEYDPCDFLKAQEFQLKRDFEDYKKSKQDDLINMLTGIQGYKGNVCFRFCKPLNEKIDLVSASQNGSILLQVVSDLIDEEICKNFEIYSINYIAYDILNNSDRFSSKYNATEKNNFVEYVNQQVDKIEIDNKDVDFLETKIIEMYANILINHLSVQD